MYHMWVPHILNGHNERPSRPIRFISSSQFHSWVASKFTRHLSPKPDEREIEIVASTSCPLSTSRWARTSMLSESNRRGSRAMEVCKTLYAASRRPHTWTLVYEGLVASSTCEPRVRTCVG
ncbi:hypothetical protein CPC08DRAFT_449322 [Agrocybe pediades]|nr:hypothetical protein CPC08DRAFT_449322 [Agrocybe pediades]